MLKTCVTPEEVNRTYVACSQSHDTVDKLQAWLHFSVDFERPFSHGVFCQASAHQPERSETIKAKCGASFRSNLSVRTQQIWFCLQRPAWAPHSLFSDLCVILEAWEERLTDCILEQQQGGGWVHTAGKRYRYLHASCKNKESVVPHSHGHWKTTKHATFHYILDLNSRL